MVPGVGHSSPLSPAGSWESGYTDREEGIWAEPIAPTDQAEGSGFPTNFICPSDRKWGTDISQTAMM